MPAVFFGHGSPMNTLAHNRYTQAWREFGRTAPRPTAVLAISAHWFMPGTAVTAMAKPQTIHDFGGFPRALSEYQYPAPGDPALAQHVREVLAPLAVRLDEKWGLDHGTWSVLTHVYPKADIPVVQLSIDSTQAPAFHYDLGKRLAPLRDEGVLIAGFGNVVHNLGKLNWKEDAPALDWANRFNDTVRERVINRDHPPLVGYESLGDDARASIPTPEHYLPLLYILGLQEQEEAASALVDGIQNASISMLSVVIGQTKQ
ncbi:MAG TPA: 4,5-DOPA dioxygenase extradiol [Burkholderiales bacterium]|nr:4,5-DOPA dioxygenase extradiol [Burkholderiales bacterium]